MKLSERLMTIASLVPKDSIVADIGTDHGYVPIYLVENQISKYCIATDISQESLQKTIDLVREKKLSDKIVTRLGDGLDTIKPFEADTLIVAGMGGLLIQEILEKNKEIADAFTYFIFQPMVASKELRAYLNEKKFRIIEEELAKEGDKIYEIIFAKKGLEYVERELDYEISPLLIRKRHPHLESFVRLKLEQAEGVLLEIENIFTDKAKERREDLEVLVDAYKEVLEEIEGRRNN